MSNWKKDLKETVEPSIDYSKYDLAAMIKQAKEHDACDHEIDRLSQFPSVDEALKNGSASMWCLWYALIVMKSRWEDVEHIIAKDPTYGFFYARDIIKDRWDMGEVYILKDACESYFYAVKIIKDRWPEAESIHALNPDWKKRYEAHFNCKI